MTALAGDGTLSMLTEDQRNERLDALHRRMSGAWAAMRPDEEGESVLVPPSVTLDRITAGSGSMTQAFEERFLFLLLLLRQPPPPGGSGDVVPRAPREP